MAAARPQGGGYHQQHHLMTLEEVRTLWIGDLQYWVDDNYLNSCFAHTGEVVSIKIIRNNITGQPEGYGFVEFVSHAAAERILQTYNGTPMPGTEQNFRLNWASFGPGEKRHDAGPEHSIFVGDLASEVTDYLLQETFRTQYPSVSDAKVVTDPNTGCSKGYGFVKFLDENERNRAVTEMNGVFCSTRPMHISVATPKKTTGFQQQYATAKAIYPVPVYTTPVQVLPADNDVNNTTIFVGNLDPNVTEELKNTFLHFGETVNVKIPVGRGCGFVQFAASSKAELKRREKQRKKAKSGGFESLNLSPDVFRAIKRKGYKVPTPIQRKTMPLILAGADVVAMARTGSGKTAAFLVPMLQRLNQHVPQGGVRALILSPTRDLALQTLKFTKELGRYTDLCISLLVGGDSMESQFKELAQNPDIIIATPGRLMHHLSEVEDMSLKTVEYVVFDEADCLFGMGFAEQLHKILGQLSENRQTLLFSATLPSALAEFAKAGLHDPHLVRLDVETRISPDLKLVFFTLRHEEKHAALLYLIREHISSDQQTLIFVSTKHHVEFLNILFREEGIEPSVCYGDMDQDARKIHISRFRARRTMLLIVTDVAARGIDIPLLDNVINWDFPPKPKIFVHRVERVARARRTGTAFSFVTSEDMAYLLDLHLFLSKPIRAAPTEEEVLLDMDGVMSKIDEAIGNGETVYGRFPQTVIDLISDRVREIIDSSVDLNSMQRTCTNAFRLYSKTKPLPSKESIRRVKDFPREGLHPMFKNVLEGGELMALAFSERLKAFRPKQTILETEGEAARSKHLQGPSRQWVDVMKNKRAVHEKIINLVHQQCFSKNVEKEVEPEPEAASLTAKEIKETRGSKRKAKSFKDEEYYISSMPTNHHMEAGLSMRSDQGFGSNRLEAAVLDLVADDNGGMQKQKQVYHWDKRGKKYIKLNNGDRLTASGNVPFLNTLPSQFKIIHSKDLRCSAVFTLFVHFFLGVQVKTESGAKSKAIKTGIYKKWKERSHKKVSLKGTGDEGNAGETTSMSGDRHLCGNNRKFRGRNRQQHLVPNAHVRSEIKDLEQVRKERQKKADRISFMKSKPQKGKKIGKNGKRGKPRK